MKSVSPTVSYRHMRVIFHALERFGYEKNELEKRFRPPALPDEASIDEYRLPATYFLDAMNLAVDLTEDPLFGAKAGFSAQLADFNIAGQLVANAKSYRMAYELYMRYQYLLSDVFTTSVRSAENASEYIFSSGFYDCEYIRPYAELRLAGMMKLSYIITGDKIAKPFQKIFLQHQPATSQDEYSELFGQSIYFGEDTSGCRISEDVLDTEIMEPDNEILEILIQKADYLESVRKRVGYFTHAVTYKIYAGLNTGKVKLEDIASSLGISSSTLKRKLEHENTSFRQISTEIKISKAIQLLSNTEFSSEFIANKTGFSNYAAFSRAIKKATGKTPSSIRNKKEE